MEERKKKAVSFIASVREARRRGSEGAEETSSYAPTSFERHREALLICAVLIGDHARHPFAQDVGCGLHGQGAHHHVAFHRHRLRGREQTQG